MTAEARRVAALADLGYTTREAAFLDRVARHSGYFVRRQFLQWIDRAVGQTVLDFTRKLVWRGHAQVQTFCRAAQVVHLCGRAVYAAAEADEHREHRRTRPAVGIKARLMALDYVAARPETHFLATESERLAYCDAAGADRLWLPQQRYAGQRGGPALLRYFLDAGPIGLETDASGTPCAVFAYVDDGGMASVAGFGTFVRRYRGVWAALPAWRLVYVADRGTRVSDAERLFRRVVAEHDGPAPRRDAETLDAFFVYGQLRRAYDAEQWAVLDKSALDRFRGLRLRFRGHAWDVLYGQWETRGEVAVRQAIAAAPAVGRLRDDAFETCVLTHAYAAMSPIGGRR